MPDLPADETLLHMRVPADVLRRGDRLRPLLQQTPELRSVRVTRAAVLRMALERGLAALEGEQALPRTDGRGRTISAVDPAYSSEQRRGPAGRSRASLRPTK